MGDLKRLLVLIGAAWCLGCAFGGASLAGSVGASGGKSRNATTGQVVIPSGQPVQIAVALDDTGFGASFGPSARAAVQMAIEHHPTIHGFPITVNAFNAPCGNGSPASLAANATTANAVVSNAQHVAVLGHACSQEAPAWLPVYQTANLTTIGGSVTGSFVAPLGPTVFNGTAVAEPDFGPWYAAVKALPSDQRWRRSFEARFGSPPADYADLYFDAANTLLTAIDETARIENRDLVLDRAALSATIRQTRGLRGVTCSITFEPASGDRTNDQAALARCAGTASVIVFASDRARANPGEIYSLAAGRAPIDVSRSAAYDGRVAVRPDGKLVAFWSDRTGVPRLYVARPDGSRLRMLPRPLPGTEASSSGESLLFSPDGSRLLAAVSGISCKLFLVDMRSLRSRLLGAGCGDASWSPDGSLIVALIDRHAVVFDATGRRRFSLRGTRALWSSERQLAVVNAAGTSTTVLDEHGSLLERLPAAVVAWSADASRLVLQRPGAILLADSATPGRARVLVRGPRDWTPFGVAFTPDGRFVRYQRASGLVVAMPVAGGTPKVLPGFGVWARDGRYAFTRPLPPALHGGLPRVQLEIGDRFGRNARAAGVFEFDDHGASSLIWSADGSRLLYESSVRAAHDLWAVNPDGSGLHRLTADGSDASAPAWSPDGTRLAYASAPFSGANCGYCVTSVVIAGADGRVQSTVPGGSAGQASMDGRPSWDPLGVRLLVDVCCSGRLDVVGVDGSGRRSLAPGPAGDSAALAVWSMDGATIEYVGGDSLEVIAPDGSGKRALLGPLGAGWGNALALSHDGTLVAYSGQDGVYLLPLDGTGQARRLVAERSPAGLSFSPDDSQLVYAAQRRGPGAAAQSDLFVIPVQGGAPRALAPSPYDDTAPAWQPIPAA